MKTVFISSLKVESAIRQRSHVSNKRPTQKNCSRVRFERTHQSIGHKHHSTLSSVRFKPLTQREQSISIDPEGLKRAFGMARTSTPLTLVPRLCVGTYYCRNGSVIWAFASPQGVSRNRVTSYNNFGLVTYRRYEKLIQATNKAAR